MPILLTCEHGGALIPSLCKDSLSISKRVLFSHRGYDFGAKEVALHLSQMLKTPLFLHEESRLVVDYNRSSHHKNFWSKYSIVLPDSIKKILLDRYTSYREKIFSNLTKHKNNPTLHLAIHSFTPIRNGVKRDADIGILYDPSRIAERELAYKMKRVLENRYKVRMNYPYQGKGDGLATTCRTVYKKNYLGLEIEFNYNILRSKKACLEVSELFSRAIQQSWSEK